MPEISEALELFNEIYNIEEELRHKKIIRSNKVKEDYGEWLAAKLFNGEISENRNEAGWDIDVNGIRYQVKTHRKGDGNNAQWSTIKTFEFHVLIFQLNPNYTIKNLFRIIPEKLTELYNSGNLLEVRGGYRLRWNLCDTINDQFKNDYPYLFE